ncbi:unnamed protein product [Cladocopium goreaui]|uniref:Uncharacterized protein n=1 Tax=Cladocopium goreaui TaxID=2562237 RepID=A0A9P1BZV8_9DINO|nr:unnamed protein product [Cladocopium goreaui]
MSNPKDLDALCPGETKRQREALRRKLQSGGLKPGLVEKFTAARTDQEKFENLKQFIMDPTLQSVVVESWFIEQAKEKSKGTWIEKPLCELEEIYKSPEDRERAKVSGTSIGVRGTVAANKAARQSLADKITAHQASFDASAGSLFPDQPANKKAKAAAKPTKVGHGSSKFQILLLMRISMLHSPFLKRRRPRKRSARKLFNTL